jgi:hypothetical protein
MMAQQSSQGIYKIFKYVTLAGNDGEENSLQQPKSHFYGTGGQMQKEELLRKTEAAVSPFETENIISFINDLTFKSAMENPWLIGFFLVIFFYAVIKRSKPVLLILFAAISIMLLVRFTLNGVDGNELTLSSTLPFAFGGLMIGGVLIYFSFIKSD